MKICIVYQGGEFPPAERIEKEAKSLITAGHEIFVFCNNYGDFKLSNEIYNGINVSRLILTFKSRTLNKILKFPIFFNPLWIFQLVTFCIENKIQALQVVDIALAPAVWFVGRILRIPIVLDMWENYPEALKGWGKVDWKTRVFKNYRIAKLVEWFSVRVFDKIIVVVEEQADRLIKQGILADKIFVVSNTVDLEQFRIEKSLLKKEEHNEFTLLYAGVITIERGLEDIINAMHILSKRGNHSIKVIIVGAGNYLSVLQALVIKLKLEDCISFPGWISFSELPTLIYNSDLCLVPHLNNEFINTTIPNKLFQYMALAKPVLVSNAEPLKRIVLETNSGYVFESGNPESAADCIEQVYLSKEERDLLGQNGFRAIRDKYNWSLSEKELIRIYEEN